MSENRLIRSAAAAALVASTAALAPSGPASAQVAYPVKPIRIVVPYTPAGTADILARVLAQKFTAVWSQPVLVDNRPGGHGSVGSAAAAKAPADGYTLLLGTAGTHAINPALYPKLPYDPLEDFAPVGLAAIVPGIVVVAGSLPVRNLRELIDHAKANPGKLAHGSPGVGSFGHLSAELLKSLAGIDMVHVASEGSAAVVQQLVSGRVQVAFDHIPPYLPQVKAGGIRALAVTASRRSPAAPQLPTVAEAGVKGYEASTWFGLFAPAGTPADVVAKLNAETRRIVALPDVRDRLLALGAQPAGDSSEAFARFLRDEIAKWAGVIRTADVTPN